MKYHASSSPPPKKWAKDVDNGGDVIPGSGVLGFGDLDKHLRSVLEDLHLVEDSGASLVMMNSSEQVEKTCLYL